MAKTNKASLISLMSELVAGLQGLVGVDSFVLGDTTYTKAQIIATLNAMSRPSALRQQPR